MTTTRPDHWEARVDAAVKAVYADADLRLEALQLDLLDPRPDGTRWTVQQVKDRRVIEAVAALRDGFREIGRTIDTTITAVAATAADLAAFLSAAFTTTPTDPHHDPRPWQDCTREDIRKGDLVAVQYDDRLGISVAHHQDADGDWWTEGGYSITHGDRWPLRRIPAPTPPAEEVEMPGKPRLLTDVVLSGGEKIAQATWTGTVLLYARHPLATNLVVAPVDQIEQWTLDGTLARRDGNHEDGRPRFVKAEAGK